VLEELEAVAEVLLDVIVSVEVEVKVAVVVRVVLDVTVSVEVEVEVVVWVKVLAASNSGATSRLDEISTAAMIIAAARNVCRPLTRLEGLSILAAHRDNGREAVGD